MPGRDQIREVILGAAEGASGSLASLGAAGLAAVVEDFDVEVSLGPGDDAAALTAVVRFAIVVDPGGEPAVRRSVA